MGDVDRRSIAVGFFDGLHLGHRQLLRRAEAVLTFRNHPLSVLAPERAPRLLMSCECRIAELRSLVSSHLVQALEFTPQLAEMPPEEFARRAFFPASHPEGLRVVCGENWRFGKGGAGDTELLTMMGLEVEVVPAVIVDGEPVSSTRVREALLAGHPEAALAMLGRNYTVTGTLVAGKGLGREIGFPTLNVDVGDIPLKTGVYVVKVAGNRAIANFGHAPTCGERAWKRPMLEIHLLKQRAFDFFRFIDGFTEISVCRFIREERRFDSLDELTAQIANDVAVARGP